MKIKAIKPLLHGLYKSVFITFIFGLGQGCAPFFGGYGPDKQPRAEFERRVEAAFRLQNQMTSVVMVLQSDGTNPLEHDPILQAEQIMEKNCRHLNEYVSRDIDGQNKSFLLLKSVESSVSNCESSARNVEELLKRHQR